LKDIHSRYIISQIARALKYLHSARLIHRDLKPSNGLVRSLKARQQAVLTEGVATRWYRSPEVLLGSKNYSTPADIWSLGCIIYEMLAQKPLFPGSCTLDQIEKICAFTGYPTE
jgi:serine/threonine protein kinase